MRGKFILFLFLFLSARLCFAEIGAGSRGSFSRGGWAGARYVAMGMTGDVIADDVFSFYWNPAGLVEIRDKQRITDDDIREKAEKGNVEGISERDLIRFSDSEGDRFAMHIGFSGGMLDLERYAGFAGMAFNLKSGVFGVGAYTITSSGIDRRDYNGVKTGELDYAAGVGYISYAWPIRVAQIGVTLKPIYEKIGHYQYIGGAADVGVQIYLFPFVKAGFVIQDIGIGLYPLEKHFGVRRKYDTGFPVMKLGLSFISGKGFTIAISGFKKLEQKNFGFCIGAELNLVSWLSLYAGLYDMNFSAGAGINAGAVNIIYALTLDRIRSGYNHIVSASVLF